MIRIIVGSLSITAAVAGCGQSYNAGSSDTKIHNGILIADDKYPAVVSVGGCTATFVSDNTLIFAAHCLGGNGSTVTVRKPFQASTSKTFRNPRYRSIGSHDVAVAIFPDGTAKNFLPIYRGPRESGEKIHLIGFGCDSTSSQRGVKREGFNELDSAAGGVLRSSRSGNWDNKGDEVTVCPGDSGGPLLIKEQLAGVTSFHTGGSGSGHPDLQFESNWEFLKQLIATEGARIHNFSEEPQLPGRDIFADIRESSGTDADQVNLRISTAGGAAYAGYCVNLSATGLCNVATPGFQRVADLVSSGNDRKIFRSGELLGINAQMTVQIITLDDRGKVLDRISITFSRK